MPHHSSCSSFTQATGISVTALHIKHECGTFPERYCHPTWSTAAQLSEITWNFQDKPSKTRPPLRRAASPTEKHLLTLGFRSICSAMEGEMEEEKPRDDLPGLHSLALMCKRLVDNLVSPETGQGSVTPIQDSCVCFQALETTASTSSGQRTSARD